MKSKYEEIRINGKRYLKHRYVWESNNGKIPSGYEVHHINGNTHDNDISNLTLMPKNEHRSYHAKRQIGRILSDQTKNKIRKAHIGMTVSESTKKKMSDSYARKNPVLCVELNKSFDTIQDAAEFIGKERKGIYNCIHKKQKTSGGYHWINLKGE